MFLACGVGAFGVAMFHVTTHAFFKALLFLGAGSVIHAMSGEQDMRKMGGLKEKIPTTYRTMLIGTIAISGIPPLAGFFSKDEILGEAFKLGFVWVWAIGIVVAIMTAFYMLRLMGKTFYGPSHVDPHVEPRVHESPPSMTWPLILLSIPTIFLGAALALPLGDGQLKHWLHPIFEEAEEALGHHPASVEIFGIDGFLIGASVAVALAGTIAAIRLFGFRVPFAGREYAPRPQLVQRLTNRFRPLYTASFNKWWFDDINHWLFVRLGGVLARALWWFDVHIIDGTVNGIAALTQGAGRGIRLIQTGRVQNYAFFIALGLLVMAGSYLVIASQ
jgi:NADH-quinone oxidoreductase subunit L